MDNEAPAEPGAPPNFSTGFWKEFSLRHSRPAVYVAVLAAYGVFTLVLFATASSHSDEVWARWLALGILSAAITVAAAVHGARRAPGPKERAAVRRLLSVAEPTGRQRVLSRWYRAEVLRSMGAPALALALLAPLYLAPGLTGVDADPVELAVGVLLWLQTAASAAAVAVLGRSPLTVVAGAFLAAVYWGFSGKVLPACASAGAFLLADLPGCFYAWHLLVEGGTGRLSDALILTEKDPELRDLAREDPASLGLDVSFWALFRWKLFRDPLFRAERRGFWTARRLVILWSSFAAVEAARELCLLLTSLGTSSGASILITATVSVIQGLPTLIVAAVVAATLATDRQTGMLDSLLITPAAPLRLAASRLAGKCIHPILALMVLAVPAYFLHAWVLQKLKWITMEGPLWVDVCYDVIWAVRRVLCISACGAVGLYFAARWRSLAAALPVTWGFLVAFVMAFSSLAQWFWSSLYDWWGKGPFDPMPGLVLAGLNTLAYGVLLRIFLVAAARQLAIRHNE
jgi:hypothetical protein